MYWSRDLYHIKLWCKWLITSSSQISHDDIKAS